MNNLDKQYQALLQDILDNGVEKKDRTGTGTISVFGRQIRHKMSEGFPLLTTKKMAWKSMVNELLWFLRGDTNIKFLVDNNCHIWDGDAYKNYEKQIPFEEVIGSDSHPLKNWMVSRRKIDHSSGYPIYERMTKESFINKIKTDDEFAKKWGELGPIYGKQWRSWSIFPELEVYKYETNNDGSTYPVSRYKRIDQIANLINDLKTNPDSRRLIVNAWNVGEIDQMVLPPCHYGFQVYTRELSVKERMEIYFKRHPDWAMIGEHSFFDKHNIPTRAISLMWNQRSVDTFLGLPFNIASYGLLLEIIAKTVNMVPDELIGNLGDVHLYSNHIEQAKEQIGRELTRDERIDLYSKEYTSGVRHNYEEPFDNFIDAKLETRNIPTRTREPYPLPTLKHLRSDEKYRLLPEFPSLWDKLKITDFKIENYQSHPTIKAPLSN